MSWPLTTYPEAVLIDMARAQAHNQKAEYFELDEDVFSENNDWLKKTDSHDYLLCFNWFVCTNCSDPESLCSCDGRRESLF